MAAIAVGIVPDAGELRSMLDRKDWQATWPGKDLNWESERILVRLMVELPFWLMMPDGEVSVAHDRATVAASVRGKYVEVMSGPFYLDSHANLIHIGSEDDLKLGTFPKAMTDIKCPVIRPLKTVVIFKAEALGDAIQASQEESARRVNQAHQYFFSLAWGHIPFLNRLITSYRSTSFDPYAFEVSEWDVPLWWVENNGTWVRISLMPYWDKDRYPTLTNLGTEEKSKVSVTTIEKVQEQAQEFVAAGKLELLDALSLFYRGRFGDAIRSAVTAIEIAVEAQLTKLLKEKGYTDEQAKSQLALTRNSFYDRLAEYERVSQKRLPGPLLSNDPFVNGVRLRSELEWVRRLRGKVVHDGIRVDIFARGMMTRAIETMTWLFNWLSWEDKHREAEKRNHTFFSAIRGQAHLTIEYKDSGVAVRPLFNPTLDPSGIKTADQMFYEQYLATIGPEVHDIDLFARMSFRPLGVNDNDAPPEEEGDPIPRERFHIDCNGKQALVFCIDLEGLIDAVTLGGITQRRLLHIQVHGPGWNTLCIVNHQRHIPIARRAVENAIPDNVSQIARESGLSLITALDLRLLIQGIVEHKWAADGIRGLLFLPGRQGVVPPAYRKIGNYLRFFDKQSAMSVQVADGETVKVGDTLGVRLAGRYHEERIESLQIDRVSVITAIGPCKAGIGTKLCKRELSVGQAVFIRTP